MLSKRSKIIIFPIAIFLIIYYFAREQHVKIQQPNKEPPVESQGVHTYFEWNPISFTLDAIEKQDMPTTYPSFEPGFNSYNNDVSQFEQGLINSTSFSQCGQDVFVEELLGKRGGFFVDLAANHWRENSNTLGLELHKHWRGVCFEPNDKYLSDLLGYRRCRVVTSPISGRTNDVVIFRFRGVLGGIVGGAYDNNELITPNDVNKPDKTMSTTTLVAVLDSLGSPHNIDYMSLDVEGAEFLVMRLHDFGRYTFTLISVERPKKEMHHLLVENGYGWLGSLGTFGDCMYLNKNYLNYEATMEKYAAMRLNTVWEKFFMGPQVEHSYLLSNHSKVLSHP